MDSSNAYEALIEFLYRSPIGLVQIDADGTIDMMNPMAAQLLMPLSGDGGLDNLYDSLELCRPAAARVGRGLAGTGVVCDSLRMPIGNCGPAGTAGAAGMPQVLSISLLKVDAQRSMAVLTDATLEGQREQRTLDSRLRRGRTHRQPDPPAEPCRRSRAAAADHRRPRGNRRRRIRRAVRQLRPLQADQRHPRPRRRRRGARPDRRCACAPRCARATRSRAAAVASNR